MILAAGSGTRFGKVAKQLAQFGGRPLLEHAIAAQCRAHGIERVVVVLGARADEVLAGVRLMCAEAVVCEEWEAGQSASLRCGLEAVAGSAKVIVTLGDQPLLTPAVIERFVAEPPGARAIYRGRPGHPVVLGPEQMRAAMTLRGDVGAREVLGGGPLIECSTLCSSADVDTPEDLEALGDEARAVV